MIRKIALAGAAGAIALGGLAAFGTGTASAAPPKGPAGPGSDVTCQMAGKASLKPGLLDGWIQADHQTDPSLAVRAIPDTAFALAGPVTVKAKTKGTCTGTAFIGSTPVQVTEISISLTNDPLNPGSATPATCAGLIIPDPENPSTARYNTTIKWKAVGGKLDPTTITGAEISSAGGAFGTSGGTITGSFAGGTSSSSSSPDLATIGAFLSSTALSPNLVGTGPGQTTNGSPCQPSLKVKAATNTKPESASIKKGKGIKKIILESGTLDIQS